MIDPWLWGVAALALPACAALLPDNLDFARPRCTVHEGTLAGTRALVLDNGIFSLSVLPEYGGRICSLFYRPLSLELLATEFIHGQRNALSVRGGWCAAFPSLLADGEMISHLPWNAEIAEQTEARCAVRLWCAIDRVSHQLEGQVRVTPGTIIVERYISLEAGEASVMVEDVLINRNIWPMATTWSGMISLRASAGDRAIVPVEGVEIQRGVGPSGNELDFGLLVSTPFQAMARHLQEGWIGFRPASAPVDIRINFPTSVLPHALIIAQRNERNPGGNAFRFQPLATPGPLAEDTRDGALILPPKEPVRLPLRLEAGTGIITSGQWSRPGLQLSELISAQHVPNGRAAIWRVGQSAIAMKTAQCLLMLLPEFGEDSLLAPEDLVNVDLMLLGTLPPRSLLRTLAQRTRARFVGPPPLRRQLMADGFGEERAVTLSPGARFDLPGLGLLATPARSAKDSDGLGYLVQADHLLLYHAGETEFLGVFGLIGQQFHPQLLFLPLSRLSMADAVNAAKLLQPRLVVPLGCDTTEQTFLARCRDQHVAFSTEMLYLAEGKQFDGWKFQPLG